MTFQTFFFQLSMAVLFISYYLLLLLLTYYCILANVTVQADNVTLQLNGKGRERNSYLYTKIQSNYFIISYYN